MTVIRDMHATGTNSCYVGPASSGMTIAGGR